MNSALYWIEKLQLKPHPEGGYYKETFRSPEMIPQHGLPSRFEGERCFVTQIFYLLEYSQKNKLHRLKADETWHFYEGLPIVLYLISPTGDFSTVTLGRGNEGFVFQYTIPNDYWFGAKVEADNGFSLIGCTVTPGFDFRDFEVGDQKQLIQQFPQCQALIEYLT